jgi:predicted Ser/Thr protein kinase
MADALIGKTIGAYLVNGELGQSRWGKVYRAWQESVHRTVALKVLSPQIAAQPGKADHFRDEVRRAAQLSHANLVAVYEAGYAEGVHFFAMELMDGPPLSQFLRKGDGVDEHHLLLAIDGVARALEFLWQRGISHQAPESENILTNQTGAVKLINIEPEEAPPSQTQRDDIVALGLMLGQLSNDISPVSKPVGELVERMVGAAGREAFATLGELAETASALDHKLFPASPPPAPNIGEVTPKKIKPIVIAGVTVVVVAVLVLLAMFLMGRAK